MSTKHPWQDWQLTAFVLNELEPDLARQIASAQANDPALAAEIQSLKSTLDQVTVVLNRESADSLGETRRAELRAKLDGAKSASKNGAAADSSEVAESPKLDRSVQTHPFIDGVAKKRLTLIGLLAMAACMLVAVMASAPFVSQWAVSHSSPSFSVPTPDAGSQLDTVNDSAILNPGFVHDDVGYMPQSSVPVEASSPPATETGEAVAAETTTTLAQTPARGQNTPLSSLSSNGDLSFLSSPNAASALELARNGLPGMEGGMSGMGGDMGMGMGGGMGMGMGMEGGMSGGMSMDASAMPGMGMPGMGMDESDVYRRRMALSDEHRFGWIGPRGTTDKYAPIQENRYVAVADEPLSTLSIDVDTASYTKVRQFLKEQRMLPPVDAVRIEEMINYFDYQYVDRNSRFEEPFIAKLAVARSPWNKERQLVRIALQAKKVDMTERPRANVVFLLDVSGSMEATNKLPLVKETLRMTIEQLGKHDRIAMVVYAGAAGCVLESTPGDQKHEILAALDRLNAGGSTNGGQGIQLAYNIARDHFVDGGINRVILCTDGDFNVGVTSTNDLVEMVAEKAKSKIFLTVLGYGDGNTNDAMMEQIADRGNGVYGFVDSRREAKRLMVKQLASNLITVAKDVKIQVEFNPNRVREYRLIGYENRLLEHTDFSNDQKDAGEIGAGHRVTALYEIIPVDASSSTSPGEKLRYQPNRIVLAQPSGAASNSSGELNNELLAVNLRFKAPEGDVSKLLTFPLKDNEQSFNQADADFRWAASVAQFGMLLRRSGHAQTTWEKLLIAATAAAGDDPDSARQECLELIEIAAGLNTARR